MVTTPHDHLFKFAFTQPEHARDLVRMVLPPGVLAQLDLDPIRVEPGTFIDEQLQGRCSDLLLTVPLVDHPAFVYVLCEHQSTTDALMPLRLLRYMTDIWAKHLREHPGATRIPAVLPVVLHHDAAPWNTPVALRALYHLSAELLGALAAHLPDFTFLLDDLATQTAEKLHQRPIGEFPRLVLWALQHARHTKNLLVPMLEMLHVMWSVLQAPKGQEALGTVMRYIMEVNKSMSPENLSELMRTELGPEAEEAVLTAAEILRREGHNEALRNVLTKQLELRFGPLPDDVLARLLEADARLLDHWVQRVILAPTLAEVFADTP